jgi:HEPN domain-containing protein
LGFLAQQACEKLIKSVMVLNAIKVARSHDMEYLVELAQAGGLNVPIPVAQLRQLTPYAIAFRYESVEQEWLKPPEAARMIEGLYRWAQDALSRSSESSEV